MSASRRVGWAIAMYASSFMLLTVSDALAKRLAVRYPVTEIAAVRFGLHFCFVCATVAACRGVGALHTKRLPLHVLRGALMACSTLCVFGALRSTPLATVTIILFVTPLFVVALQSPVLGEVVPRMQWIAVLVGLGGAVVVLRPAMGEPSPGMLLATVAALCGASYQLASRRLARTERPLVGLFYVTLVGTISVGALAIPEWRVPGTDDWPYMIAMGLIAAAAYFGIFKSIEFASPARLAPFFYLQIITAIALSYAVFDEVPDAGALLGMCAIVASGLVCMLGRRDAASACSQEARS
jgi:drug/metabolite transporter (DMT)-like permease